MKFLRRKKARHMLLGSSGEAWAIKLFRKRNCLILARNWRNNTTHDGAGELDIVLLDGETLVFGEVKTRSKLDEYLPGANLSDSQKKRIRQGAKAYCRKYNIDESIAKRFDLVEVILDGKKLVDIALHENYMAFFQSDFLTHN